MHRDLIVVRPDETSSSKEFAHYSDDELMTRLYDSLGASPHDVAPGSEELSSQEDSHVPGFAERMLGAMKDKNIIQARHVKLGTAAARFTMPARQTNLHHYTSDQPPHIKRQLLEQARPLLLDVLRTFGLDRATSHDDHELTFISPQNLAELTCSRGEFQMDCAYKAHPFTPNLYIPVADYHDYLMQEKKSELLSIAAALGARSVTIKHNRQTVVERGMQAGIDEPTGLLNLGGNASVKPEYVRRFSLEYRCDEVPLKLPFKPEHLVWVSSEPLWQRMIKTRLSYGCTRFGVEFGSTQNFALDAQLASRIEQLGFSIGGKYQEHIEHTQEYDVEFWGMSHFQEKPLSSEQ
jgi:hypothetical protein